MREERIALGNLSLAASASGERGAPVIVLLHGWPHDRTLYDPVVERLGERFHVLAFDLPGIGDSQGMPHSAEKHALADLVLTAADQVGAHSPVVAGIDVGGMIAFAAARDHGPRIAGAAIGNTAIPGLAPWEELLANPQIWHFAFHSLPELPELLVAGHERAYFDFFFDALGSKTDPLPSAARDRFAGAYQRPEALKAGFDWYRTLPADAKRNADARPIEPPILYFRGDADGRTPDEYVDGLRAAGVRRLRGEPLTGTAEFAPVEAPERFASMLAKFAESCFAGEPASA